MQKSIRRLTPVSLQLKIKWKVIEIKSWMPSLLFEGRLGSLRKQLVDDFEFITHLGKLIKLPRTHPNVNDIFKTYFDYRLKKNGSIADSVEEIMKGLCCYFDKAPPTMLLYNNEHKQYQEACPNDNIVPSDIYRAEHLLRLFGMLISPSQKR